MLLVAAPALVVTAQGCAVMSSGACTDKASCDDLDGAMSSRPDVTLADSPDEVGAVEAGDDHTIPADAPWGRSARRRSGERGRSAATPRGGPDRSRAARRGPRWLRGDRRLHQRHRRQLRRQDRLRGPALPAGLHLRPGGARRLARAHRVLAGGGRRRASLRDRLRRAGRPSRWHARRGGRRVQRAPAARAGKFARCPEGFSSRPTASGAARP